MKEYGKKVGKVPIIGEQASESDSREKSYLKTGCNNFSEKDPKSKPLGFWREQDILEYIYTYNLEIASVYGEVKINSKGKYYTTGESRTGCVACGFGCSMWKTDKDNRYLMLEKTHPKFHNYVINVLGYKNILEFMNIKYTNNVNGATIKEKQKLGSEEVEQLKWVI